MTSRALLREHQQRQVTRRSAVPDKPTGEAVQAANERGANAGKLAELRRELNTLVALHNHRTGKPHGVIHGELRKECGGPPTAVATADQLRQRIGALRRWN